MQQKESRNEAAQKEKNPMAAPAIELPKGGGAIGGMGEKFAANPVTGTGSMSVPIAVSSGRSGFAPQLSLSYDSGDPLDSAGAFPCRPSPAKPTKACRSTTTLPNLICSSSPGRKI